MKRIVVLISGQGSNLDAIVRASEAQDWPGRVVAVISNRADARGLQSAQAHGIATEVLDHKAFADRAAFDAALAETVDRHAPDLVVLAGFMRILTPGVRGALRGPHAQRAPVAAAVVHRAEHAPAGDRGGLQGGRRHGALRQRRAGSRADRRAGRGAGAGRTTTRRRSPRRVLAAEHVLYPRAVGWFVKGELRIEGRPGDAPRPASRKAGSPEPADFPARAHERPRTTIFSRSCGASGAVRASFQR